METIISACISAAVTLVVCLISNHSQQEKTRDGIQVGRAHETGR